MKDKENIATKFSNFNPDVDEEAINKSWKKIKQFVPKNEKRSFLFFLTPYIYCSWIVFLAFGISSGALIYFLASNKINSNEIANKSNITRQKYFSTNKKVNSQNADKVPIIKEKINLSSKENKYLSNTISIKKKNTNLVNKIIKLQQSKIANAANNKKNNLKLSTEFNKNINSTTDNEFAESIVNQKDSNIYQRLEMIPLLYFQLKDLDKEIILSKLNDEALPILKNNRLSIDIFSSVNFINNQIKHSSIGETKNNTAIGYAIGFGANYLIKNKLSVVGQFNFNKNKLFYESMISENKAVTTNSNIITPTSLDTSLYIQANIYYRIKSMYNYHLGAGIEYELFNKNRIVISGSALVNMRFTKYKYEIFRSLGKDTLTYLPQNSNTTFESLVSPDFTEGSTNQVKNNISFGLSSGFMLAYKLNTKCTFFLRPSFNIELYSTELGIKIPDFRVKQKSIFIQLGTRFTF